jgi:hypothetical protein
MPAMRTSASVSVAPRARTELLPRCQARAWRLPGPPATSTYLYSYTPPAGRGRSTRHRSPGVQSISGPFASTQEPARHPPSLVPVQRPAEPQPRPRHLVQHLHPYCQWTIGRRGGEGGGPAHPGWRASRPGTGAGHTRRGSGSRSAPSPAACRLPAASVAAAAATAPAPAPPAPGPTDAAPRPPPRPPCPGPPARARAACSAAALVRLAGRARPRPGWRAWAGGRPGRPGMPRGGPEEARPSSPPPRAGTTTPCWLGRAVQRSPASLRVK